MENALKKCGILQGVFYVSYKENVCFSAGKRTFLPLETYVSGKGDVYIRWMFQGKRRGVWPISSIALNNRFFFVSFRTRFTLQSDAYENDGVVYPAVERRADAQSHRAIGRCDSSGRRRMGFDGKAHRIRLPAMQADG